MWELIITLVVFLFPLAYSPGPGNIFFAANGARFGFKATASSLVGYHIATWIVTLLIGCSFDRVAMQYPDFFRIIGFAGILYIFYLALLFFRSSKVEATVKSKQISFMDGVILLLLNPKAYVIIAAMFSQFLATSNSIYQVLLISTVFTLNNLVAFCLWAFIGDKLLYNFRSEKNAKFMNISFAIILGTVATWMLVKLVNG